MAATAHLPAFRFPYTWDESGKCEMLLEDHSCMVYQDRPLLCQVEKVAQVMGHDQAAFYKQNHQVCLALQEIDQVEDRYRLKL